MNNQYPKDAFEVHSIGKTAAAVLSGAEQGTVFASVTDAVYLQNQRGDLCWLIPMDAPMHQRGIKIVGKVPRLRAGIKYQAVDHTLAIDSEKILDYRHSKIWKEPIASVKGIMPASALSGTLSLVAEQLFIQCYPAGFGCLINPILQLAIHNESASSLNFENSIAAKAWPEVNGLIQAFQRKDDEIFIHHVKSLIGLGEGLTPSGDDFLGGFFYSIQILQNHYSKAVKIPISTYFDSILRMKPLTNLLSYTILIDHIAGHSVEPLHQLAEGILSGVPVDELIYHAKRLISLGHSTGWDLLAGFFTGMSFAFAQ